MKVTLLQHIASYFIPIKIWKGSGSRHSVLELFLYKGNWQLTTEDAIYSDGTRYRPLVKAFRKIGTKLNEIKHVLVLGGGIGSAIRILNKLGLHPQTDVVDNDEEVLKLARQTLSTQEVAYWMDDAAHFIVNVQKRYDLIVVDVFSGRKVPAFVSTEIFIRECRRHLNTGGIIVINFMINDSEDKERYGFLKQLLPESQEIHIGINKVLIYNLAD